jgi:hypothetical protein
MRRVHQMNGQSIVVRTVTDCGRPGRRSILGGSISIGTAVWAIFRDLGGAGVMRGWTFWVEDIASGATVAGPFDAAHRPDAALRKS